jgi:hypothetical protein
MKILRQTVSAKLELEGKRGRELRRQDQTWETPVGLKGAVNCSLQLLQVLHTAHPVLQDQQAPYQDGGILAPAVEASSPDGVRLALKIQKRHDGEAEARQRQRQRQDLQLDGRK